jgi:hypothetical protein
MADRPTAEDCLRPLLAAALRLFEPVPLAAGTHHDGPRLTGPAAATLPQPGELLSAEGLRHAAGRGRTPLEVVLQIAYAHGHAAGHAARQEEVDMLREMADGLLGVLAGGVPKP